VQSGKKLSKWISHLEYRDLQRLIEDQCGIFYSEEKLETFKERVFEHFEISLFSDFRDYVHALTTDKEFFKSLIERLTVNETFMFRHQTQLDWWVKNVVEPWVGNAKRGDCFNLWCAACSTGEEAYTLSILLTEHLASSPKNLSFKIFASDIDPKVIQTAQESKYAHRSLNHVPKDIRDRYFTLHDESWRPIESIKSAIEFRRRNLMEPYDCEEKFDVIFCRNVMIYFRDSARQKVLDNFSAVLKKGGYLFLGNAESLPKEELRFQPAEASQGFAYLHEGKS